MEHKKGMSIVTAVIICLVFVGAIIFISLKTDNMSETAKVGDLVSVNYTGKLVDGTVFDSNVDPKFRHVKAFVFPLGAGKVIPGWEEGIVGMKVGEKKTLVIPPEKAYGPNDYGPIPGNSTLTFDVELVEIIKDN
ncbi:MAG: FKBP-type peptidyl-prolyl cis-trans isomerase [Candidatus Paceibacterota bacterium]|jgi:FKBP-type peptidyl-prolyl cis-trans isomerase